MPQLGAFEKALRVGEGRRTKRLKEQATYIASLEPEFQQLSDAELRAKTAEFRQRLENGEELDNLLFEAYAAVREARVRESDQRMFDVQMMGGIVLHEGDIAEMKTGEGKTFVATQALYLNAIAGPDQNPVTHQGARLSALYQVNDDWNVLISESLSRLDAEGLATEYPVGTDFQPLKPLQVTAFSPTYDKDRFQNTAWTVNGKIGPIRAANVVIWSQ